MVVDSVGRNQVSVVRSSWRRLPVRYSIHGETCVCILVRTVIDAIHKTTAT